MATSLDDRQWSSFPYTVGTMPAQDWFDTDWLLNQFRTIRQSVIHAYYTLVMAANRLPRPFAQTHPQLLMDYDTFVERHYHAVVPEALREISKAHRRAIALPLKTCQAQHPHTEVAMTSVNLTGADTMAQIAQHLDVHFMTVSRAVWKSEASRKSMHTD